MPQILIKADILAKKHKLTERQHKAVQYILQEGRLSITEFEELCDEVPRRTLQRDLKALVDKEIVLAEGATSQLSYILAP